MHYRPHWEWVVREFPPNQLDSYRVEARLRTTDPDPGNVVILGDSTALASLDPFVFEGRFPERHFIPITIGGSNTVSFGFLANAILDIDAKAAILVVSPYGTRDQINYAGVNVYDVRAAPSMFTLDEVLAEPSFHLMGLAAQSHVLIRHRWVLQQSLRVYLETTDWAELRRGYMRGRLRAMRHGDFGPIVGWMRSRDPVVYPNPNTRAIRYLARRMRENGGVLVLMESPVHPLMKLLVPATRTAPFREYLETIVREEGLVFITNEDLPELKVEHFGDQSHMNAVGSALVTQVVATRLRDVL